MRALLSVYDKTGLEAFAQGLAELGFELVSSGGTADHLDAAGLEVTRVEDVTSAPEMLEGRVKTLHPKIHGGILARRDIPEDMETLAEQGIEPFELVCVNLYPFASTIARLGVIDAEVVEMIDVGGPSILRSAAKNFAFVIAVCKPEQYEVVLDELRTRGSVSLELRRSLANEAFGLTASYDATIASWFETEEFPEQLTLAFQGVDLPYGEPHQRAAYYSEIGARHLLSNVDHSEGGLSYSNLADLDGARRVPGIFRADGRAVKARQPCVRRDRRTIEAYERALTAVGVGVRLRDDPQPAVSARSAHGSPSSSSR